MIEAEWPEVKTFIDEREIDCHYVDLGQSYAIRAFDGIFMVGCKIKKGDINADWLADFETNYKPLANKKIEKKDLSGISLVASSKRIGDFSTIITHNFCDNSSWVIDETDSTWQLFPGEGETHSIIKAEVQFTSDLSISPGKLFMDYYIWHPSYPGAPVLGMTIEFDSVIKLFELGNEHYHSIALPETPNPITTIVFNYVNSLVLYGDETPLKLAGIKIRTEDHNEITGTYATVGLVTELL